MKGVWIIEYGCGCSADSRKKKDLLEYCGVHGNDQRRIYFVPDVLIMNKEKLNSKK